MTKIHIENNNFPSEMSMSDLGNHIACPFCPEKDKQISQLKLVINTLHKQLHDVSHIEHDAFRLYCAFYRHLEENGMYENIATYIDYVSGRDFSKYSNAYKELKLFDLTPDDIFNKTDEELDLCLDQELNSNLNFNLEGDNNNDK